MIVTDVKTKNDASKLLALKEMRFLAAIEIVNETDSKEASTKLNALIKQKKKLHAIIIERG